MKLFAKKKSKNIDNSWFDQLEVDINKYASDIILITKSNKIFSFKNNTTGETSENLYDVARDGHRFILMKERAVNKRAYLMINDKEHDALIILTAKAEKVGSTYKWQVCEKAYITRDGRSRGLLGDNALAIYNFPETDISGQAVVDDDFAEITHFHNYPVLSKKEAFDYFGAFKFTFFKDTPNIRRGIMDLFSTNGIKETLRLYKKRADIEKSDRRNKHVICVSDYSILNLNMDDRNEKNAQIPLPEEALAAIKDYIQRWLKEAYLVSIRRDKAIDEMACVITILQKYKSYAVQRSFIPYVYVDAHFGKSVFDVVETERVWYAKNIDINEIKYSESYQYMNNFIIWRDDLKGTVFEYASFIIDDFINLFKAEISKSENNISSSYYLAEKNFASKYGILQNKTMVVSAVVGTNHVFEKLIKKIMAMINAETDEDKKRKINDALKSVIHIAVRHPIDVFPKHTYGKVDMSQTKLHKALGIPSPMLDVLIEKDRLSYLNDIKEIFDFKQQHRDYFMQMNKDACMELFDLTLHPFPTGMRCILKKLIIFKGVDNCHNYINFLKNLSHEDARTYYRFIDIMVKDAAGPKKFTNIDWRLKDSELQNVMSSVEVLTWTEKEDKKRRYQKKFAKVSKEWKTYSYSDGGYVVAYPQNPQDLVLESIKLRHCAKEFIDPVCKKETIVLFIRKIKEPEKPFFTIEVRNGEIRQCHGFANCHPDEALRSFIKGFCKAKNIKYKDDLTRCYGPME